MTTAVRIPKDVKLLSGSTSNGEPTFPWKLHMVLEESERLGLSGIISWQGDNTFRVHDQRQFELRVMKSYFKQTQYRSFQRQLNIYGFKRLKTGSDAGSYIHPFFVRGKADMCCFMRRTKIKKKGLKSKITIPDGPLSKTSHSSDRTALLRGTLSPLDLKNDTNACCNSDNMLPISSSEPPLAFSNMNLEPTVFHEGTDPIISPIPLVRKPPIFDQASVYEGNAMKNPILDMDIGSLTKLSSSPAALLGFDHNFGSKCNALQQNMVVSSQKLSQKQLQYPLNPRPNQNQAALSSSNCFTNLGSWNTCVQNSNDVELDLDTIFDDQ